MTPLLLLHPLGSDGSFWDGVAGLLGREVAAPDLPGHGAAAVPEDPATVEAYADVVAAALDGPVVAVGISLGGLVAQALAVRRPDLVAGLVLVDTVAVYPSPFRDTWPQRAAVARDVGLEPLADAMEAMWFGDGFRARHPDAVATARRTFVATDPEGYARTCEALHVADLASQLPGLDVPALVVCGDQDAPAFVEAAPALAAALPDAGLQWLRGARHACVLEQPETFAAVVRRFLDERGL